MRRPVAVRPLVPVLLALVAMLLLPVAFARGGAAEINRAVKDAKKAVVADDGAALEKALAVIVSEGGKTAARELLELMAAFPEGRGQLYWQVVGAAASLTDEQGLDAIGDYLVSNGKKPQARDLLFSMQSNRSPGVLAIYAKLLKRGKVDEIRLMAVDRLGELARPEAVDALMEAYEKEEGSGSVLERRIHSTLVALFGEDMGAYVNFKGHWEQNRDTAIGGGHKDGGSTTGTVKDELDAARRGGLASVSRGAGKVLVLEGNTENFDKIQDMLRRLDIPHEVMQKTKFMEDMEKALEGVSAIVLNCNYFQDVCRCPTCVPGINPASRLPTCTQCDKHELSNDGLTDKAAERIRKFVEEESGSVFTEDWGLRELIAKAWPKLVKDGTDLTGQEVRYAPVPGQTASPLLRGVLARPGGGEGGRTVTAYGDSDNKWKIDNLSPSIQILDTTGVTVLLESEDLAKASEGNGAVAITFSPRAGGGTEAQRRPTTGRGKKGDAEPPSGVVLHVLSHFGKQGNKEDEFTLQNLLVNFLLEASERWQLRRRG